MKCKNCGSDFPLKLGRLCIICGFGKNGDSIRALEFAKQATKKVPKANRQRYIDKFMKGHEEHGGIWKISDEELDKEIEGEHIDLLFYKAEKKRRKVTKQR